MVRTEPEVRRVRPPRMTISRIRGGVLDGCTPEWHRAWMRWSTNSSTTSSPSHQLLAATYCRSCTSGFGTTVCGEVTLTVLLPDLSTEAETVPSPSGTVCADRPAGADT